MRKTALVSIALLVGLAGMAQAREARPAPLTRVRVLAHELDAATEDLFRTADRSPYRYRFGFRSHRALREVRDLWREARDFHRAVDRRLPSRRVLAHRWEDVEEAWADGLYAVEVLPYDPYVERELRRVAFVLHKLRRAYVRLDRYGGPHPVWYLEPEDPRYRRWAVRFSAHLVFGDDDEDEPVFRRIVRERDEDRDRDGDERRGRRLRDRDDERDDDDRDRDDARFVRRR